MKKLKECESELTQKGEMVSRLQSKAEQIGKILNNLEKYNHLINQDADAKGVKSPTTANVDKALKSPQGDGKCLLPRHSSSNMGDSIKSKYKENEGQPPTKKIDLKEIPPFKSKIKKNEEISMPPVSEGVVNNP